MHLSLHNMPEAFEGFLDGLIAQYRPERVILFGSRAAGLEDDDSDVDLLVVLDHESRSAVKAGEIRVHLDPPFPLDLVVRTPTEIEQRSKMGDSFIRSILRDGKVLYDSDRLRMDS